MNYASALAFRRREEITVAPYGFRSKDTKGRKHFENEHEFRSPFQRDKDRIIHTTSFRRLEYKTQVFVNDEGDYYRTRLTHTLEVAQIGRTLARALGANEDLVESICLAHDLGHPPFGHAGEATLANLMIDFGSFEHNEQTLRIVTFLERRYDAFPGLNLCYETLEGIAKHETEYDKAAIAEYSPDLRGGLEAQIANAADEIAYSAHDLDDGLRSGILAPDQCRDLLIWRELVNQVGWIGPDFTDLDRHRIIHALTNNIVSDVFYSTESRIKEAHIQSVDELQRLPYNVICNSETQRLQNRELKDFLFANFYRHYRVMRMSYKAEQIITRLFQTFQKEPRLLPTHIQENIEERGLERTICDYIAGMTDRYALSQYRKLFDPSFIP